LTDYSCYDLCRIIWKTAFLITTNNRADSINSLIISRFQALEMDYFSIDTVINNEESVHFPTEFLNSETPSSMPPHKISLKVEVPII
jgi:hypothetical protein